MLIPTMRDHFRKGYARIFRIGRPPVFFPNCNLAICKEAFEMAGGYDESLKATEDVDICSRVSHLGWELFFEPEAKCFHASRKNIIKVMQQWFWYGYWNAFALKKNMEKECEIFFSFSSKPRINRYLRLLATNKSPFPILVFISYFPMMHLLGIGALFSMVIGFYWMALILSLFFVLLAFGINWSNPVVRGVSLRKCVDFWCMTYLINISCMLGSFAGGFRNGMLYSYPGL